jgi:hypothetical protein
MEHPVVWAVLFGAWLPVIDPVYQAALKLQKEEAGDIKSPRWWALCTQAMSVTSTEGRRTGAPS